MSEIVLVHGNAGGVEFAFFGRDKKYADFIAFKSQIDQNIAKVYRWHYIDEKYSLFDTFLNPFKFIRLYFSERKFCSNPKALQAMYEFMQIEQPKTVLGHSLGAFQIFNYLNQFDIPDSITKIVLVQGAFPSRQMVTNPKILSKIKSKKLVIENYHSRFDQMLLIYTMAHMHRPGGLFGSRESLIKNTKLTKPGIGNPHLWTLENAEFAQKILS